MNFATVEEMIEEAGGAGPYQTQSTIVLILTLACSYFILIALPFLLLPPSFRCFANDGSDLSGYDCVPSNFCTDKNIRAEKIPSRTTFTNWMTDFDMICSNPQVLLGFYLLIFTGLVIGGLFLAPLTDKFGKKKPLAIALVLMILLYTLIILADSYTKLHYYMLVYGILLAVIIVAGLLLMLQLTVRERWPILILFTLCAI